MTRLPQGERHHPSPLGLLVLLVLVVAAACGATGTATSAPGASASGSAAVDEPQPSATRWPGTVVEAVMILAKADKDIQAAGADLGAAAAYQDLEAMWGAADGLATLVGKLETQVPRIKDYTTTKDLAAAYDKAFPDMLAGATKLRDSIKSGDAKGIEAGSQQLAAGIAAYQQVRSLLGPIADQALLMQKLLTK